jgi:membrane-bound lytic murein transglycosylase B
VNEPFWNRRTLVTTLVVSALVALVLIGCGALFITLAGSSAGKGSLSSEKSQQQNRDRVKKAIRVPAPTESDDNTDDEDKIVHPDEGWVENVANQSGVPARALQAYAMAALTLEEEEPNCGIGWNTLAAIGEVETHHGNFQGATLSDEGFAEPRIIGPALDGQYYDAIADTDDGELDNDTNWDHAVGPMQFLPEMWRTYGRDGNGDKRKDVDQIDDASLAAATLLCSEGGDLTQPDNWIRAIQAYNPSVAYNNDVADLADRYGSIE